MVEVAAARIRRDHTFLIGQRPKTKACALLREFVGGKLEKIKETYLKTPT